tara:strand:- start:104 stop:313 length:210 start_codon:yes stop_codon:yes gene_type:complete
MKAFDYLKPTEGQLGDMEKVRAAAQVYCDALERLLPEGPDKTFTIRNHRTTAMWANICITRKPDGSPRE